MKNFIKIILFFLVIIISILVAVILSFNLPYSTGSNKKIVYITYGSGLKKIAAQLKENKVIRNKFLFEIYMIFKKKYKEIKAGEYEFSDSDSMKRVVSKIIKGEMLKHKIVIPEGLDIYDIADILASEKIVEKEKFLKLVNDKNFIEKLGLNYNTLEGLLFPDTYYFVIGEGEEKVIITMFEKFKKIVNLNLSQRYTINGYNLNGYSILKLASIVEKEAKLDDERPIIASVFYNRLKSPEPYQRKLESCATVRYALNKKTGPLTFKDLEANSKYNTYKIIGLPPSPICNPGLKSIQAVLHPANTNYLYFVVKNNGSHSFSTNFEDHIKNKILRKHGK